MHGKIKRYKDVIKIKAKECSSKTLVAETLWQYVGINGRLYGRIRGELGWQTIREIIYERKLKFLQRILKLPTNSWVFKIYDYLMKMLKVGELISG